MFNDLNEVDGRLRAVEFIERNVPDIVLINEILEFDPNDTTDPNEIAYYKELMLEANNRGLYEQIKRVYQSREIRRDK